jgi:hypothetical protein
LDFQNMEPRISGRADTLPSIGTFAYNNHARK